MDYSGYTPIFDYGGAGDEDDAEAAAQAAAAADVEAASPALTARIVSAVETAFNSLSMDDDDDEAGGSLRTTIRMQNGARLTFRMDACARTRFVVEDTAV
jgi:hypothetical protein